MTLIKIVLPELAEYKTTLDILAPSFKSGGIMTATITVNTAQVHSVFILFINVLCVCYE